ncbi:DUF2975 domain-containing protein [Streptomyces sp. NPDC087300]|uniref:DUF2975 domain-containing protein n=1 Tax=Streptomyces sp. NPDC087300 TaxID=3365780 RepID=UPI0037F52E77
MVEGRKLLEPLFSTVSVALRVVVGVVVVGFVLSLFVDGVHFSWVGGDVCVTAEGTSGSSRSADVMFGAREGVDVSSTPRYCASDPSSSQRALDALRTLPSFTLMIGGLFLLNRLLKGAIRDGVYAPRTASRLRVLGWSLLLGSLAVEVTQAIAQSALLATLADSDMASVGDMWQIPFFSIFTALGLLTFARIVRAGVVMREEIEATI